MPGFVGILTSNLHFTDTHFWLLCSLFACHKQKLTCIIHKNARLFFLKLAQINIWYLATSYPCPNAQAITKSERVSIYFSPLYSSNSK